MRHRSIAFVIALSLITFGIYYIYWLYKTRREMVGHGQHIPPLWLLFVPWFIFIVYILLESTSNFFQTSYTSNNWLIGSSTTTGTGNIFGLIVLVIGSLAIMAMIPVAIYWFYGYCKAAQAITNEDMKLETSLMLVLLLGFFGVSFFIWPGIMQSAFNKTTPSTVV